MEKIVIKHLKFVIETNKDVYKKNSREFNTSAYNRLSHIIKNKVEDNINNIYNNLNSEQYYSSFNNRDIIIKNITLKLGEIDINNISKTFPEKLGNKLSAEFTTNINKDIAEQLSFSISYDIMSICEEVKQFLKDGIVTNNHCYVEIVNDYEKILSLYEKNDKNPTLECDFKDYLINIFAKENSCRRFVDIFPVSIIERTINYLFEGSSTVMYNIINNLFEKVRTFIPKNEILHTKLEMKDVLKSNDGLNNYKTLGDNIFENHFMASTKSIQNLDVNEKTKRELYKSMLAHYEQFGYVHEKQFLEKTIEVINNEEMKDFVLVSQEDDIIVVTKEDLLKKYINGEKNDGFEGDSLAISVEEENVGESHIDIVQEIYSHIHNVQRVEEDVDALLCFLKENKSKITRRVVFLSSVELLSALEKINFKDKDIEPIIDLIDKNLVNSYRFMRCILEKNREILNLYSLKFFREAEISTKKNISEQSEEKDLCTNSGNENIERYMNFIFSAIRNTQEEDKMDLEYVDKYEGEEGEVLKLLFTQIVNNKNEGIAVEKEVVKVFDLLLQQFYKTKKQEHLSNIIPSPRLENNLEYDHPQRYFSVISSGIIKNFLISSEMITAMNDFYEFCSNIIKKKIFPTNIHPQKNIEEVLAENDIQIQEETREKIISEIENVLEEIKKFISLNSEIYSSVNSLQKQETKISLKLKGINKEEVQQKTNADKKENFSENNSFNNDVKILSFEVYDELLFRLKETFSGAITPPQNLFNKIINFFEKVKEKSIIVPEVILSCFHKNNKKGIADVFDECLTNTIRKLKIGKNIPKGIMCTSSSAVEKDNELPQTDFLRVLLEYTSQWDRSKTFQQTEERIYKTDIAEVADDNFHFSQQEIEENIIKFLSSSLPEKVLFVEKIKRIIKKKERGNFKKLITGLSNVSSTQQKTFLLFLERMLAEEEYVLFAKRMISESENKTPQRIFKLFPPNPQQNISSIGGNIYRSALLFLISNRTEETYKIKHIANEDLLLCARIRCLLEIDIKDNNGVLFDFIKKKIKKKEVIKKQCCKNGNKSTSEMLIFNAILKNIAAFSGVNSKKQKKEEKQNISSQLAGVKQHEIEIKEDISNFSKSEKKVEGNLNSPEDKEKEDKEQTEKQLKTKLIKEIHINNGGLVFLYPFLEEYLVRLSLWDSDKNKFTNDFSQNNAIHALQYILTSKDVNREWDVVLNKILSGKEFNDIVETEYVFADDEKKKKEQKKGLREMSLWIIKECIRKWEELDSLHQFTEFKNGVTVKKFKEYFLKRHAMIKVYLVYDEIEDVEEVEEKIASEDNIIYVVELSNKIYDDIIKTIPWNFETIQFPWMKRKVYITNSVINYKEKKEV